MSDLDAVYRYGFKECEPKQWYTGGPAFDTQIKERFGRYPMRNQAIGRTSNLAEEAYIVERAGKAF